jgi:RNase P/RNase MRP subunit p29
MPINTNLLGKKVWVLEVGMHHKVGLLKSITENFLVLETKGGKDVIINAKEVLKVEEFREKRGERDGREVFG